MSVKPDYLEAFKSRSSNVITFENFQIFSIRLQEIVGACDFERNLVSAVQQLNAVPASVVHLQTFDPSTKTSIFTDANGTVKQRGMPIAKSFNSNLLELPRFKKTVESSLAPRALSLVERNEAIKQSTIFKKVLAPFGMVDILHIPLMQAKIRKSMILVNRDTYKPAHLRLAGMVQKHIIAAMQNHYWLRHSEVNEENLAKVQGDSVILEVSKDGVIDSWSRCEEAFLGLMGPSEVFPKKVPEELLKWVKERARTFPLSNPEQNSTSIPLTESPTKYGTVFLGNRHGKHKLLIHKPQEFPAGLGLTPRETEVLSWLCQGKTNPEIAIILGISRYTARNHVERILAKLQVDHRQQAMAMARKWFGH